ncbi:MAG: hypothetical protein WCL37_05485 [Chrysiogenales bacterium]
MESEIALAAWELPKTNIFTSWAFFRKLETLNKIVELLSKTDGPINISASRIKMKIGSRKKNALRMNFLKSVFMFRNYSK